MFFLRFATKQTPKSIKKFAKIGLVILLVLITVPSLSLLFLQNRQVQSLISGFLTRKASQNLDTEISVSSVHYSFFKRLELNDLYIEDQSGDTLFYSETARIRIKQFKPKEKNIHLAYVDLDNFQMNLFINKDTINNLKFLVQALRNDTLLPREKNIIQIDRIQLTNSEFAMQRDREGKDLPGVDFNDMNVSGLQARADDFRFDKDTIYMKIRDLSGTERSGFRMEDVNFSLEISKESMKFRKARIKTPRSYAELPLIGFSFSEFRDFRKINSSVEMEITSDYSHFYMPELAYFVPVFAGYRQYVGIKGNLFGTINDLKGTDLLVEYNDNSLLDFDMEMRGLPDFKNTYMHFSFHDLVTDVKDIQSLTQSLKTDVFRDSLLWDDVGRIRYQGRFTGYPDDFVAYGNLETDLGNLLLDLYLQPDTSQIVRFKGNLQAESFHIGELLDLEEVIEEVSLTVALEGSRHKNQLDLHLDGTIDALEVYDYMYSNIDIDGILTNESFDGSFSIRDPNIEMSFAGSMDFSSEVPHFNFETDVARLRPYYLNLRDDDPGYFASFFLETDLQGSSLDELNGEVRLVNSLFKRTGSQIQIYDFLLSVKNSRDTSFLTVSSDAIDGEMSGRYRFSRLPATFKGLLQKHLEVFDGELPPVDTAGSFRFNLDFKDVEPVMAFFFPAFHIANGSHIKGSFHSKPYQFSTTGDIPRLGYSGNRFDQFHFQLTGDSSSMGLSFYGDSLISRGELSLTYPEASVNISDNQTGLQFSWGREDPAYSGAFTAEGRLIPGRDSLQYILDILPTQFLYDRQLFRISKSEIRFAPGAVQFDSMRVDAADKYILATGSYSRREDDEVNINLKNLNIATISNMAGSLNLDVGGNLSGMATLKREDMKPVFLSDLTIDSLEVNKALIGDTHILARWEEQSRSLDLNVVSQRGDIKTIDIQGNYVPSSEQLDFSVLLSRIHLSSFNPYVDVLVSNLDGLGNADLTIDGTLKEPLINGDLRFQKSTLLVDFLQTEYRFSDVIKIYENDLYLEGFEVYDQYGNKSTVVGEISHRNFSDFNLALELDADNFQFLNTSSSDNEQFYGEVYGTGNVSFIGPPDDLFLDITAKTERNTNFNLPLYKASEITSSDFITFIEAEDTSMRSATGQRDNIRGLQMEMDLEVTPDASVQLIFDPKVGDIIEASGSGNLKMVLDENGKFSMYGGVDLQDGEYLFTLQNVINKRFRVKPGGTIIWSGEPSEADIDLQAIYDLKAAPYNLSPNADESLKKRIPVNCLLTLRGDLSNPTIQPSISLPTAEPETKNLLENNVSTEEALMRQFISLLVMNNFYSSTGFGAGIASSMGSAGVAGVTASELLSNQLSNWLSQISNDFDIGINYRPGDEITSDEVEVALSTQLLNDRILLSGNVGVGGTNTNAPGTAGSEASEIVGDFKVEFRVTDNISIKAFNRANDDIIFKTAPYTQGVGVFYRTEFDHFRELFKGNRDIRQEEEGNSSSDNDDQDQ